MDPFECLAQFVAAVVGVEEREDVGADFWSDAWSSVVVIELCMDMGGVRVSDFGIDKLSSSKLPTYLDNAISVDVLKHFVHEGMCCLEVGIDDCGGQ